MGEEAILREKIASDVQGLFAQAGFKPIETPTLEAMDVISQGGRVPSAPFKFFDSRGDLLAMRPDVTMQVARMAARRLRQDGTARLRYTQRVFRDQRGEADACAREITQIGIECLGESGVDVDIELVTLLLKALNLAEVHEVTLALATVAPLRALLARSGAGADWQNAVLAAYHSSDFVELDRLCALDACDDVDTTGIAPMYADAIRSLAKIRGGRDAIDKALSIVTPLGCEGGLAEFAAIFDAVSAAVDDAADRYAEDAESDGVDVSIKDAESDGASMSIKDAESDGTIDPVKDASSDNGISDNGIYYGETRRPDIKLLVDFSLMSSFDYYTGLIFEAYSPYVGSAIGSGGRYDNMLAGYGAARPAAGFAFCLEEVMASAANEPVSASVERSANATQLSVPASQSDRQPASQPVSQDDPQSISQHSSQPAHRGASQPSSQPAFRSASQAVSKKLRIAVPKGALHAQAVESLKEAGLDTSPLAQIGRQLVVSTDDIDYIIVRPSDAPAFVAYGAADIGICGRDSLLESEAQVVKLVDLGFGACRFVVAEPVGATASINERYRRLGSIRVATKYPNITLAHYARTGVQVDIVQLHGNIELAPLTGMAERIVDITATGTTLRENNLEIVEEVLSSTAQLFANPCALRTDDRVVELADKLQKVSEGKVYEAIAGKAM